MPNVNDDTNPTFDVRVVGHPNTALHRYNNSCTGNVPNVNDDKDRFGP